MHGSEPSMECHTLQSCLLNATRAKSIFSLLVRSVSICKVSLQSKLDETACRQLFEGIEAQQGSSRYSVRIMFLEIHNEEVKDLLHPDTPARVPLFFLFFSFLQLFVSRASCESVARLSCTACATSLETHKHGCRTQLQPRGSDLFGIHACCLP